MTDRFVEIAQELRPLLTAAVGGEIVETEIRSHIKARQILMTPEEGWPGKNAEQRKFAQEKAESEDVLMQGLSKRLLHCQDKRGAVAAHIDGLRDERRGLEWQIRRALVLQLAATSGVDLDLGNDPLDVAPFEAFLDKEATRAFFDTPYEDQPQPDAGPPPTDIEGEEVSVTIVEEMEKVDESLTKIASELGIDAEQIKVPAASAAANHKDAVEVRSGSLRGPVEPEEGKTEEEILKDIGDRLEEKKKTHPIQPTIPGAVPEPTHHDEIPF